MGKIEKLAGPGRIRKAKAPRDWRVLVSICLFASLTPSLHELSLLFPGDGLDRREVDAAGDVVLLCLPAALLCIAKLLTGGARSSRDAGTVTARLAHDVGLGRVLVLATVLGFVFLILGFILMLPVLILAYATKFVALLIAFGAGYGSALAVSALLLRHWSFSVEDPSPERRIAAAAFGFILASFLVGVSLTAPVAGH